jgi:hypothetical protein
MIAYCGLDCEKCEAFIATKNNDNHLRAKVSEEWAKLYNAPIMPEHINCRVADQRASRPTIASRCARLGTDSTFKVDSKGNIVFFPYK